MSLFKPMHFNKTQITYLLNLKIENKIKPYLLQFLSSQVAHGDFSNENMIGARITATSTLR